MANLLGTQSMQTNERKFCCFASVAYEFMSKNYESNIRRERKMVILPTKSLFFGHQGGGEFENMCDDYELVQWQMQFNSTNTLGKRGMP